MHEPDTQTPAASFPAIFQPPLEVQLEMLDQCNVNSDGENFRQLTAPLITFRNIINF